MSQDRELEVARMLQNPSLSTRIALALAATVFLGAIYGSFALDLIWSAPPPRRAAPKPPPSLAELRTGAGLRAIEERLRDESFVRQRVTPPWALFLFRTFRHLTGGVVAGADAWLFDGARLKRHPLADAGFEVRLAAAIRELTLALEARGTRLQVLLVPRKGLVARSKLGPLSLDDPEAEERFLGLLQAAGARAPNLLPPLLMGPPEAVWIDADTHWSPEGARRFAEAAVLAMRGGLAAHPLLEMRPAPKPRPLAGGLRGTAGMPRLVGEPGQPGGTQVGQDFDFLQAGERAEFSVQAQRSARAAPVWLCGTSFTDHLGIFGRALEHYLGEPVRDFSAPGRGPLFALDAAIQEAQRSGQWPADLVWELPAFYVFALWHRDTPPDAAVRQITASLPHPH